MNLASSIVGGKVMGAELVDFQIVELPEGKVVGKEVRVGMSPEALDLIPDFWATCLADETIAVLRKLDGLLYPNALVGWVGDYRPSDQSYVYLVGMVAGPDVIPPVGFTARALSARRYGVGYIRGPAPDIYPQARDLTAAELLRRHLAADEQAGFEIEWYDDERFNGAGATHVLDFYVPLRGDESGG
jgi:predicted transcriptional regulator YdeE